MYLDANNLYGVSMSKQLPYKNSKWSNEVTLDPNNLKTGIYKLISKFLKIYIINLKIFQFVLKLNQ